LNSYVTTLTCLFLITTTTLAQTGSYRGSTASVGMGNIATLSTEVWSALTNPAGLGLSPAFSVGIQHEQRYLMPELGISVLAASLPILGGGLGFHLSNTGFSNYGENRAGIAMGRRIGKAVSIGGSIDFHLIRFPAGYPNSWAVSGNVGIYAQPAEALCLGLYISNLSFSKFSNEAADPLPVVMNWGIGYKVFNNLLLCAEVEKDLRMPLRVKAGAEYYPVKVFALRAGLLSAPFETHFGMGFIYRRYRIDFAVQEHPILGWSPQCGVTAIF